MSEWQCEEGDKYLSRHAFSFDRERLTTVESISYPTSFLIKPTG
ncbi:hypothetical protein ACIQZM_08340 [Peribacillus sp. NPDC097206]